jgi:acyl carrier protein
MSGAVTRGDAVDLSAAIYAVRTVAAGRLAGDRPGVIDADTRLDELSLDSLDLAELFALLEERAGAHLDASSVERVVTVGDLTKLRALTRL